MTDELLKGLYKFCDEKSKNIKLKAEPQVFVELCNALEELKELRKFKDGFSDLGKLYSEIRQEERNTAIDELIFKIIEHKTKGYVTGITHNSFEFGACQMADDIVKLAEQLKAGGENDK